MARAPLQAGTRGVNLNAIVDLEWVDGVTFSDNVICDWNSANQVEVSHRDSTSLFPAGDPGAGFLDLGACP